MSVGFSITFDPRLGLSLVAGETLVTDLVAVAVERRPDGTFSCAVTRGDGATPVRLVASATREGRQALERAVGRESPDVPGFVEVPATPVPATATSASEAKPSVLDDIARSFGYEPARGSG